MENEMVERVARAQFARAYRVAPDEPGFGGLPDGPERDEWLAAARVAIEAMREPTEAQYEALSATDKMWREMTSRFVWQTYIDAALSPT